MLNQIILTSNLVYNDIPGLVGTRVIDLKFFLEMEDFPISAVKENPHSLK